ncbi:DUF5131 family protein [Thermomonospora umbrina]|uniref:Protein gp37 n=1 Tax=Thermomonospora umbrina TaxID=111806 RepID=A0A3D9T0C8_9ACTN|nr:DUF5131 family protein [Thermomonospora umbrina]REF00251.1 protein gp37 [Thermomonospora umbrina]
MSDNSKIEWTDHTFNPWWGCSRVSPACRSCYADAQAQRYGHQVWRRKGPRQMLSDANWAKPHRWNRAAEAAGKPAKVFCASMADVFEDHADVAEARERLWQVIEDTPWLRWQLLTKRPENVAAMAPWGTSWPGHVWLGTSVENQRFAEQRILTLLRIPAPVLFLSCEPLLGPVDLRNLRAGNGALIDCLAGDVKTSDGREVYAACPNSVSWVIAGGESGPKSRETNIEWVRDLVRQCEDTSAAAFVKQLGTAYARDVFVGGRSVYAQGDRKAGDPTFWPEPFPRRFPGGESR